MLSVVLGVWVLPLVFAFTGWLRPADYACPAWAFWPGAAVFAASLILRWMAHRDLGRHWSPTLEVTQDQVLVTDGMYARIRHPIYVSLILWAAAQPLLLQNGVAGWGGAVAVALMWLVRVPKEESMMLKAFGDAYREYTARTGRIIPKRHAWRADSPGGGGSIW